MRECRVCGCTDACGCGETDVWVEETLCSWCEADIADGLRTDPNRVPTYGRRLRPRRVA